MNRTALFPGSFDPFTLGHKIVVDQGLELFERIVIAVGVNTEKRGLLTPENRARLIRDLYRNDSRIEVVIYNELTGKVTADMDKLTMCKKLGASILFVGDDWYGTDKWREYEKEFAEAGVRIIYFPYTRGVSSTQVSKALAAVRGETEGQA